MTLAALSGALACSSPEAKPVGIRGELALPAPGKGTALFDDVLALRRSRRTFTAETLTVEEISRLMWAGQGITDDSGRRTAPSAGGLYPLELYLVTAEGVSRYVPAGHKLEQLDLPDVRGELASASLNQKAAREAPLVIVPVGVVARTRAEYGDRAERFVALEVGHATQNILLEATAMGLGAVTLGTFEDDTVRSLLELPSGWFPYYVVCVGHPGG